MKRAILIHIEAGKVECGHCVYKALNYRGGGYVCSNPEFEEANGSIAALLGQERLSMCLLAEHVAKPAVNKVKITEFRKVVPPTAAPLSVDAQCAAGDPQPRLTGEQEGDEERVDARKEKP